MMHCTESRQLISISVEAQIKYNAVTMLEEQNRTNRPCVPWFHLMEWGESIGTKIYHLQGKING